VACVVLAGSSAAAEEWRALYRQQEELVHLKVTDADQKATDHVEHAEPNQEKATAVRISGYVRAKGVTGVRSGNFLIVANLTYETTPVFWYTIVYPQVGTTPWQYVEKHVRSRLPIKEIDISFRLRAKGEAWFRDFKVVEIPSWEEKPDVLVGILGDSISVMAYVPDEHTYWYRLEELLRDRFPENRVQVRCIAESGEHSKRLLESGRLERELATLPRGDFMVINYGHNDAGKRIPIPDFQNQMKQICDRVLEKFPECEILLATQVPRIREPYEKAVREMAAERKYPLVDLNAFLKREASRGNYNWHRGRKSLIGLRAERNPPDDPTGLKGNKHPNVYGGQLMAEETFRVLAPLVAKELTADKE